jgi:hypothetical protein
MSWGREILRAFLLAFGTMEILTNFNFLNREKGLVSARKQHRELPSQLPDHKIRMKAVLMLLFGFIFFIASLSSYILHKYIPELITIPAGLFCIYAIMEAFYYRYWKTFGFAAVSILLLIISIII